MKYVASDRARRENVPPHILFILPTIISAVIAPIISAVITPIVSAVITPVFFAAVAVAGSTDSAVAGGWSSEHISHKRILFVYDILEKHLCENEMTKIRLKYLIECFRMMLDFTGCFGYIVDIAWRAFRVRRKKRGIVDEDA